MSPSDCPLLGDSSHPGSLTPLHRDQFPSLDSPLWALTQAAGRPRLSVHYSPVWGPEPHSMPITSEQAPPCCFPPPSKTRGRGHYSPTPAPVCFSRVPFGSRSRHQSPELLSSHTLSLSRCHHTDSRMASRCRLPLHAHTAHSLAPCSASQVGPRLACPAMPGPTLTREPATPTRLLIHEPRLTFLSTGSGSRPARPTWRRSAVSPHAPPSPATVSSLRGAPRSLSPTTPAA